MRVSEHGRSLPSEASPFSAARLVVTAVSLSCGREIAHPPFPVHWFYLSALAVAAAAELCSSRAAEHLASLSAPPVSDSGKFGG